MTDIFERVVLPVADPADAAATCRALDGYDAGSVLAVHVVEKAGGAPDKASVEQREAFADEIFDVVADCLGGTTDLDTRIAYGTDVAEAIFEVADEFDATAIVITPRGGSRWIQLLTGDVALSLVTETDRPVVVLPDVDEADAERADGGGENRADESEENRADESEENRAAENDDRDGGTDGE